MYIYSKFNCIIVRMLQGQWFNNFEILKEVFYHLSAKGSYQELPLPCT